VWSRLGRGMASAVGLTLAAGFVAGSGLMNFTFLSHQAERPGEGMVLGAVAIGVTGYNALGPLFVGWAWENGRRLFVVGAGSLMWGVFVGFSLLCAVGFTASNRGAVTGAREAAAARLESAQKSLLKTEADLGALKKPGRAPSVIEDAVNEMKQDRRWVSSKGCSEATVEASRDYCRGYFQVRQEYEAALAFARLVGLREQQNTEVLRLKTAGAGREADPQASVLVRLTGGMLALSGAQLWLNSWAALVVEMGAALIPAVALGHGFAGRKRRGLPGGVPRPAGQIRELELCADGTWQVRE
jgi:hypothetical protein